MLSDLRAIVKWILIWVPPIVATMAIFWIVLRSGPNPPPFPRSQVPREAHVSDRCSWSCHNNGCRHTPRLPGFISGDSGLFGITVGLLHKAGSAIMPRKPNHGYAVVNLAVFCVLWPGLMWLLYGIAIKQRLELREMDRARRGLS